MAGEVVWEVRWSGLGIICLALFSFQCGHDPHWQLTNNDAYPMLDEIGTLVRTGPTGTNVMDVVGFLVE